MQAENIGLGFGLISLTGTFSLIGSLLPFVIPSKYKEHHSTLLSGSLSFAAGILVFVSLTDILSDASSAFGSSDVVDKVHATTLTLSCFFGGILCLVVGKMLIKKHSNTDDEERTLNDIEGKKKVIERSSYELTVILALHNIPEGLIIFTSTATSKYLGIVTALGLMIHKLPEGFIVSMPLYISTGSKTKAFLFSFIATMFFMFVGAVIGYGILIGGSEYDNFPNGVILSFAAGILFWMGIASLLPMARKLVEGKNKEGMVDRCLLAGAFIVAISQIILSYEG